MVPISLKGIVDPEFDKERCYTRPSFSNPETFSIRVRIQGSDAPSRANKGTSEEIQKHEDF